MIQCQLHLESWALKEPFGIAREVITEQPVITISLSDGQGHIGRAEAAGVDYDGETPAGIAAQITALLPRLHDRLTGQDLLRLLPAGGARNALDCALWDLRAKQTGVPVWQRAGLQTPVALTTAYTIGLGDEEVVTPVEEVERWTRTFATVPDEVRVGYQACAETLRATAPRPLPAVVVHGDYRLGNMLCDEDGVTAIIDWEIWSRSDPRIDLSWLLFFTDEARHPVVPADLDSGMPSDAELLAVYETETGAPVPDLDWFHALTRYKEAAAMALIAKHLARKGDTDTLARMSVMLPGLIAEAHDRVR